MFLRILALAAGLGGAAGLSQFPEYSQQYTQRLGGAVDELAQVVARFDADVDSVGLTRETALEQLARGGEFGAARAKSLTETLSRYERLSADLAAIEDAGPFMRARLAPHLTDPQIARRAWEAYRPAMPLTFEGVVFAVVGFLAGAALVGLPGRAVRGGLRSRRGLRAARA